MTVQIPLVYLDQNILSEISKGGLQILSDQICSGRIQLIYSHIHITETARRNNQDFQTKVIQALTAMNGAYIHQGRLHFDKSPKMRLDECLANPAVYGRVSGCLAQFTHKFFGGQQGKNFQTLIDAQQEALADLMREMSINIEMLSENKRAEIQHMLPILEAMPNLVQQQFKEQAAELSARLDEIPSPETLNGAKYFRDAMGIAPISLNNIRPPNVMQRIWEQVRAPGEIPPQISSASDFLEQGVWAHMKDGEPTWEGKIGDYYSLLNFIGYCPDENLHKDGGFRSAMGDHIHASYAAFAQLFITCDEKMAKKTYAIYEHLGIKTVICWCKNDKQGEFVLLAGEKIFHN